MIEGWTRTQIAGKPADVFDPAGPPRFAVLYLHPVGLESLADNATYTAELAKHRLACCAPFGARSWWSDRVCPEFDPTLTAERHLLDHVVPWMRDRWSRPIGVVGISMGGQGAVRLGFKHPERFPVVASVAGAFDYHELYGQGTPIDDMYRSREACRQDTAILHVHPTRFPPHMWFACDPGDADWFRGNDRLHEKLAAVGLPHTADLTTAAGGHSWAYFDAMAGPLFDFVVASLEKQNRRLM
jgi:pimeloyl-ACP methyl ester carboxylesterase